MPDVPAATRLITASHSVMMGTTMSDHPTAGKTALLELKKNRAPHWADFLPFEGVRIDNETKGSHYRKSISIAPVGFRVYNGRLMPLPFSLSQNCARTRSDPSDKLAP